MPRTKTPAPPRYGIPVVCDNCDRAHDPHSLRDHNGDSRIPWTDDFIVCPECCIAGVMQGDGSTRIAKEKDLRKLKDDCGPQGLALVIAAIQEAKVARAMKAIQDHGATRQQEGSLKISPPEGEGWGMSGNTPVYVELGLGEEATDRGNEVGYDDTDDDYDDSENEYDEDEYA